MHQYKATIKGMACGECEAHINNMIRTSLNVKKVSSNRKKNETIIVCEDALTEQQVRDVIAPTGYDFEGMVEEEYKKKGLFG